MSERIIDAVMRLAPECDFKTAPEAGFHTGTPDPEVLRIAAEDDRVLVSHDLKTLPQHFGKFIERSISPGVIVIRQEVTIRDAALWLQYFHDVGTPEDKWFLRSRHRSVDSFPIPTVEGHKALPSETNDDDNITCTVVVLSA